MERPVNTFRIALGADFIGFDLKNDLKALLEVDTRISQIMDIGVYSEQDHNDYPNIGFALAQQIAMGEVDRGLLICGTGIGMSISANKVFGVRAAVVHDPYSLERAILSNNCQVICLGARVVSKELAKTLIKPWLGYTFDDASNSNFKVRKIATLEQEFRKRDPQ